MKTNLKTIIKNNFLQHLILIGIIAIGAFLRFYNINWDSNFHLHPDERFLTMVGNAIKIPLNIKDYFDPLTSSLNPINVGYPFFVYGILPLTLNKIFALLLQNDTYNSFTIIGRYLSAIIDTFLIIVLYKITSLLEKEFKLNSLIKYLSAFFYSISVLPIQLSHFFTVDIFLSFFMLLSFYSILRFWQGKKLFFLIISALFAGAAMSSKIAGIFILPLNITFITFAVLSNRTLSISRVFMLIKSLTIYIILIYIFLRMFNPYLFEASSFLNPTISNNLIKNLEQLKIMSAKESLFPPSLQWIGKTPILFSVVNTAVYGLGIPLFVLILIGISYTIVKFIKTPIAVITVWMLTVFLLLSLQFVQTMRYFIFLYPFLSFFAGMGVPTLIKRRAWLVSIVLFLVLLWPSAFFSIYTKPHSRIAASNWIYDNIPHNSIILTEHWDDSLPLPVNLNKTYTTTQLRIFDKDTPEKMQLINQMLNQGDYLIISSTRGYKSIFTAKEFFPDTNKLYEDLFSNKTSYKKIAEFTSYPSFKYIGVPIEIPDDNAEEAFTVYDHPRVVIFKNVRSYVPSTIN